MKTLHFWFIFLVLLLLTACTPQAVPTPKPRPTATPTPTPAPLAPAIPTPAPWGDWEKVVEAAKKEGKVNIYSVSIHPIGRVPLVRAFKETYGITAEIVPGLPADLSAKISMEQRAKAYVADVYEAGGASPYLVMKPQGLVATEKLLLPSALEKGVWNIDPYSMDPDGHILMFSQSTGGWPLVNTKLVKPEEEPKSWVDLLDRRWKGKMIMDDPTRPGLVSQAFTRLLDMGGMDYARRLAEVEPKISRDRRELIDSVSRGEYHINFFAISAYALEAMEKGAPVKMVKVKEGFPPGGYSLLVVKNAQHPNAAKLFINWLMSREGQLVYSKGMGIPSNRMDVSQEHIHPVMRIEPGEKILMPLSPQFLTKWNEAMETAKDVFKLR